MGLKLKEGEYIILQFKAFNWTKWGPNLSGSWDTFYFTNKRLAIKMFIIPITQTIPWNDISFMGEGEKGLRIEGIWKRAKITIDITTKKLDEDTIFQFLQLARSRDRFGTVV